MFAGPSRVVVLVALAAFIGDANCIGACQADTCNVPVKTSCHHHQHKQTDREPVHCSHQHSEFFSPKANLSRTIPADASSVPLLLVESAAFDSLRSTLRSALDTGPSSRGRPRSTVSVLRI
jgi:hypothetical protein